MQLIPRFLLASALALSLATPAGGGIQGLRPGGVGGLGPSQPESLRRGPEGERKARPPRPPKPPHRPRRVISPFFLERERIERETIFIPVPYPEARPEEQAEPPPPPDPRGPATLIPARGAAQGGERLEPGDVIPRDVPIVLLDWRQHGLPEPEAGETWARLRRQVVLIDATTREVLSLAPAGDASGDDGEASAGSR